MAEQSDDLAKYEEHTELLEEVGARYTAARDHRSPWRTEGKKHFDFYAGRQWGPEEMNVLQEQGRPPIVFNRAHKMISAVRGHEANNRNEVRYIPRTQGDASVNEAVTSVSSFFLDECDGEDEQSDAFTDMLICGEGWTNTRVDDEENEGGDLVVEREDPFTMLTDPSSKKPNYADARYIFKEKRFAREEVKAMFPNWNGQYSPAEWDLDDDDDAAKTWTKNSYTGRSDRTNTAHRDILVLEYQRRRIECDYVVVKPAADEFSEPDQVTLDQDAWEDNEEEIKKAGWDYYKQKRAVFERFFFVGREVVHQDTVNPKGFTYHCITGYRDREKGHWFGLMRLLMDPQQWSNKWLSQILHILNTQAKGGLMYEESAVDDISDLEARWAKAGGTFKFKDGALQNKRILERGIPQFPAGFDKLLEYANASFGDVSGINAELLGMADREQPGVLEWQRKQSAVTLLAPLFDSLRRYRKQFGRCWLYFIQKYMATDPERLVRIVVDDQEQALQIGLLGLNDETAEYDVIVDQQASAPNQKEATWAVLTELIPAIKDVLPPQMWMLFLKYSPLPESLLMEMRDEVEKQQQQGPPPDPEMMKAQAQIEAKKAEMEMKRQEKQEEMAFKREEHALEMQMEQEKMQMERQKMLMQLEIEKMKAGIQLELAQQKAQQDIQIGQMQGQAEMARSQQEIQMLRERGNAEIDIKRQTADQDGKIKAKSAEQDAQIKAKSAAQERELAAAEASAPRRVRKIVRGKDGRAAGIED